MPVNDGPLDRDPVSGEPIGREPRGRTGGGGNPPPTPPTPDPPPPPPAPHIPPRTQRPGTPPPGRPSDGDTTFIPHVPKTPAKTVIPPRRRSSTPDPRKGQTVIIEDPPTGKKPTGVIPRIVSVDLPSRSSVFKPNLDTPLLPLYGPFYDVGAQLVYDVVQPDGSCVTAWAISYRCSSIANIRVDGAPLATFTGQIEVHLGDPATDPTHSLLRTYTAGIVPLGWAPPVAMVVARFPAVTVATPQAPDTTKFLCDGVGMPLRDHRQDATLVTRYSNIAGNFALQLADFLADSSFGAGRPLAEVYGNPTMLDGAADDCDHIIDGGTTKRYSGGLRLEPRYVDQQIEFMRSHAALNVSFNNGAFNYWIDKSRSASAFAITSEGASANVISAGPWEYPGRKQITTRYRINFVNIDGGSKEDTVHSDDPLLASGGVTFSESVLTLGWITKDMAQRLANQYRKRISLGQGSWIRMNAEWINLLPGVRVPVTSDQLNTAAADTVITDVRSSSSETYPTLGEVHFEPYSDDIYDDTKVTAASTVPPLNPSPWGTVPGTPPAPVVTQVGHDLQIDFSPIAGYAYYKEQNITWQIGSGAEVPLGHASEGPLYLIGVTMGVAYTIRAYVVSIIGIIGLAAAATPFTPVYAQAETPFNPYFDFSNPGKISLWMNAAPTRTRTRYGSGAWSQSGSGFTGFDASKVNDGNFTNSAGVATGTGYLVLDLGSAKSIREARGTTSALASGLISFAAQQYSDNNSTWSSIDISPSGGKQGLSNSADTYTTLVLADSNNGLCGAHRYWRWLFPNALTLYEFQVYEYSSSSSPDTKAIRVYDISSGSTHPTLFATLENAGLAPPSTAQKLPLDVSPIVRHDIPGTVNSYCVAVRFAGVNPDGTESAEVMDIALLNFAYDISTAPASAVATRSGTETIENKTLSSLSGVGVTSGQINSTSQFGCNAYRSAALSLADSTITAINFDAESADIGACHSTSSNTSRITVPTGGAGRWLIIAQLEFSSNSTGRRLVRIKKNGTTVIARTLVSAANGDDTILSVSVMDMSAADADYYEVEGFQTSGGSLALNVSDSAMCFASAVKLF